MCRCYEEDDRFVCWFRFLLGAMAALLLSGLFLCGCMTVNVTDSLLVNSSLSQEKPIRAGVSTTGEALGELIKAAGWGGPALDVETLTGLIEEYRKLRAQRSPQ
jgi:hypothetical protein